MCPYCNKCFCFDASDSLVAITVTADGQTKQAAGFEHLVIEEKQIFPAIAALAAYLVLLKENLATPASGGPDSTLFLHDEQDRKWFLFSPSRSYFIKLPPFGPFP